MITLLMFLLMPLLSSPVIAAASVNTTATTTNTGAGPTAISFVPGPWSFPDVGVRTATFVCTYDFSDTLGNPAGSNHQATLYVQKTSTSPPGPVLPASSPLWWLSAASVSGSFQLSDNYTFFEVPVTWTIFLNVTCTDLFTSTSASMNTSSTLTIF